MAKTYDLITIGGGIGGAALAGAMAERGASVLVLERETQFKDRVRGEGITPWGCDEARQLGIYETLLATCGHEVRYANAHFGSLQPPVRDLVATTEYKFTPAMFLSSGNAGGAARLSGVEGRGSSPRSYGHPCRRWSITKRDRGNSRR